MSKSIVLSFFLVLIIACGGGGSSDGGGPPASYDISIIGPSDDTALAGESVGLVLRAPETGITNISWQQTSGPMVSFLGANRKVIGFDVPEAGTYSFSVSFRDSGGGARSATYSFTATDASQVFINARLDHEANSQAKMSLIAYDNFPGTITSVNWEQVTGPTATLTDTDQLAIYFTAPTVTSETLLQFRVSASDDQGNQGTDIVNVLLEPETISPDSFFTDGRFAANSLADVYPYNSNSPYADLLQDCVYSNTSTTLCTLGEFPFLGSMNSNPTTEQIMDRVLVSHDWMGERFRDFLENIDTSDDIKNLLGATTSIVLSYDIRPSFFWSGSGAIYINPEYFYVTPQERDTLDHAPDFRSDFDRDLQIRDPWRIVKDNEYAFSNPLIESRQSRAIVDSQYRVLRVFYHELAHANDYFPPRVWANAQDSDYAYTYASQNSPDSSGLDNTFPLSSQEMYGLGEVMFQGQTASAEQQAYTPEQVSGFLFPDDATNTYNYSTFREDYAMLAEEYMMTYRFGVLYDQAISGLAPDYIIATAERGRVGHDRIKPRAEYVISRILPSINLQEASATLPTPIELQSGVSWFDSLVPPTQGQAKTMALHERKAHPVTFGQDFHLNKELPKK
ncbi:MAG: hypothetical protein OQJ89_12470 [Kangiellaceae bacterium]|nr:hypothetical protein [Kangiellaceae bacterium]MCW9017776.1 hypothetical protein [Kangiellaceae bacterium]